MNNKKGISAVVATVLIILITVAAVTIIWAAIIPMIKGNLEAGTECYEANQALSIESSEFTCSDGSTVEVQVSRGAKEISLVGVQVSVTDNVGSSTSEEFFTGLPGANEKKVFDFSVINATTATVAPIILIDGHNVTCEATNPVSVPTC